MRTFHTDGLTPQSLAELQRDLRVEDLLTWSSPEWRSAYYQITRTSPRTSARALPTIPCTLCRTLVRPPSTICPSCQRHYREVLSTAKRLLRNYP